MFGLGVLFALFVLASIGGVASAWLVRRVWQRRASLPRAVRVLGVLVMALVVCGALGTVVGIVKAFGAVGGESVDPSQNARILAEGIAEAMNGIAFSILVWVPCAVAGWALTRRPASR